MALIKGLKAGTNAFIMILIVFAILAMVNILIARAFFRIDLTDGKMYTISKSTKTVLGRLDDIIKVTAYFSKNLPPHLVNLSQQVKDILDEYQVYGHGKVHTAFTDPKEDAKVEEKMPGIGIPEVRAQTVEKDKAQVVNVYLGIAVEYEDKKEVIPLVQNINTLEYDLTSAIIKVSSKKAKTIGFLTGHDEYDIYEDGDYSAVRDELQQAKYSVSKVDTTNGKKISDDVDTLIVAGPKKQVGERDKYEIDQFIMRGGRAVFLVDAIQMPRGMLYGAPLSTGLNDMLEHYGAKLGNNLVLDQSMSNVSFGSNIGGMSVSYSLPYPYWPRIIKKNFSQIHPITNQLESLVLPWTSSVEVVAAKGGEIKSEELVKSTEHAWTVQGQYDLNPQQRFYQTPSEKKSYTLAVELSGKFKSFYAGKPIPKVESTGEEKSSPSENESGRKTLEESKETQIIVVGNSNFIANNILGGLGGSQANSNMIFFQNLVDWLTLGEELINIRSRGVTDRPLKEDLSETTKSFIKFSCTLGIPIIIVIFAFVRFYMRRRTKKLFESYQA
jgi:gliding-associated putative ABC transporter substrate-binding component GldG